MATASLLPLNGFAGNILSDFDMTLDGTAVADAISKTNYDVVYGSLPPFNVSGARGEALRFDGYTNYVVAKLPEKTLSQFTFSLWCAAESYPMMNVSEAETSPTYTTISGNLDETNKTGFSVMLSSQGDLQVKFYSKGWVGSLTASEKLPRTSWNHLVLTLKSDKKLYLYNNGTLLGSKNTMGEISLGTGDFYIGKSSAELKYDKCNINTFCGLIDDIKLYDEAMTSVVEDNTPETTPNYAYPASRYQENLYSRLWRPSFHAMPSGGWTNECHGMAYSNGRYHLFFQKNANGPYMARLHWGHISSENLYDWKEENIAFGPSESYDLKGCWSGCVFSSNTLTGGIPMAFYTAVNNGKASICSATPQDNDLAVWKKNVSNPLISGRPSTLTDDFRDCYVFEANGSYYMVVGSSKNEVGVCSLHKYSNGTWSNDGTLFFSGANKNTAGCFWEMPNVTPMGNGKYLFTATPLETSVGVETLYWVGTINADGTFNNITPLSSPGKVELDGFSKEGYGLLSPTVFQKDGKTLALGIVPDKLGTNFNYDMGWAHNYSLPREWTIENDELVQKPYEGLKNMRTATSYSLGEATITEAQDLGDVKGRAVEVEAEFVVGSSTFGLNFLNADSKGAKLRYNPAQGILTLDLTGVARISNDGGVFDGVYTASIPSKPATGETMKMHVFFDHSIFDIFINDRWAASVRVFPTDETADGVQVYANGRTTVKSLNAWTLDPSQASGIGLVRNGDNATMPSPPSLYNIAGQRVSTDYKGILVNDGGKFYNR